MNLLFIMAQSIIQFFNTNGLFMEISTSESAEIKFLIHQNADLKTYFGQKKISGLTYLALSNVKEILLYLIRQTYMVNSFKKLNKNITTMNVIRFNM